MYHRYIALLSGLLLCMGANAQELRRMEPEFSDYIPLLKAAGYEMFTFDISSLKDETYTIAFVTREYSKGELVSDSSRDGFTRTIANRKMISDFPEASQKRILDEGRAYDPEKGIYTLGEKISIGFYPAADSVKKAMLSVENMGSWGSTLRLQPLDAPGFEGQYHYDFRPFKVDTIRLGEFVPLLMVGSFWYDERFHIIRFCGEKELPADMSSEMLKMLPHYFLIGIVVNKK